LAGNGNRKLSGATSEPAFSSSTKSSPYLTIRLFRVVRLTAILAMKHLPAFGSLALGGPSESEINPRRLAMIVQKPKQEQSCLDYNESGPPQKISLQHRTNN
jgi:hypothetical protein